MPDVTPILKMMNVPPKLSDWRRSPFYDIKDVSGLTDITQEMRENYWGNSLLKTLDFEVVRVFSIPNGVKENHETLIKAARAACKGKIAAFITDSSLKIALENEEDAVLLKMFLG